MTQQTADIWQIARDIHPDFSPATAINYISRIVPADQFRETYQAFRVFSTAAIDAQGNA